MRFLLTYSAFVVTCFGVTKLAADISARSDTTWQQALSEKIYENLVMAEQENNSYLTPGYHIEEDPWGDVTKVTLEQPGVRTTVVNVPAGCYSAHPEWDVPGCISSFIPRYVYSHAPHR